MKKGILATTLILCLICPGAIPAEEVGPSITVQGNGRTEVTPDLATISFAVTEEGEKANDLQKSITDKANAVKDALLEAGLPEDQFRTAGVQLYTQYDYSEGVETAVGYRGEISMSVNEISISDVGKYLQILSRNGVNQINGISVFYSGYEDAYCEALEKAMQQARKKAEALANAEGASVTGLYTVKEGYENDSLRSMTKSVSNSYAMEEYEEAAMDDAGGLEYMAGTTEVEAVVTVCYEIDPNGE